MANKGLKSYTKQIGGSVGIINYYVNVNKEDSNLILDIPVLESGGINPINLSLIYNHQNRLITSKYGAGINTSYDYKLNEIDSNTINITNPDGSVDLYVQDEVFHHITLRQYTIYKSLTSDFSLVKETIYTSGIEKFYLKDKMGNKYWWKNGYDYISNIECVNGFTINYKPEDGVLINNGLETKITYTLNSLGNMNQLFCYEGVLEQSRTTFNIRTSDNILSDLIYTYAGVTTEAYEFEFNSTYIRIYDQKRQYGVKFTLEEDRVVSIFEEYYSEEEVDEGYYEYVISDSLLLYDITYFDNKTWVQDKYGKYLYIVFEDGLLSYEYDDKYNFLEYKYNKETKRIKFQGLPINIHEIKDSKIELIGPNIELEEITPSSLLLNTGFSKEYKITNQKLEYDISYNGKAYENIMLVMFGLQNEPWSLIDLSGESLISLKQSSIKLSLYNDDTLIEEDYDIFTKKVIDNNYKLMTLGVTSKETFNKIKVTLDVVNTNINISNILLFSKAYGTKYTYDEENNIKEITTGKVSKQNKYEENLIKDQINADSSEYVYDYDEKGNPIKSVTGYGVVVEREYDEETNQLKKKTTITNEGYITEDYTYENGNVKTVSTYYNETGNINYEYDNNRRPILVKNDVLTNSITYNPDSSFNKLEVKNTEDNDVLASISYTYLDKNIKTVTLTNGTIYQFNYDTRKRLTSITLNGVTIVRYTYDTKDNITKKYYNNNYYEFTYNSDYNLQSVYYNGELRYSYTYSYNKLKSVIDHKTGKIITYNYDLDGKVVQIYDGNNEASNNLRIDYDYDIYGNISNSHKLVKGFNLNEGYDSISKSGGSEASKLNNLFNDNNWYYGTMFTGSADLKGTLGEYEFRTVPEGEYKLTTLDGVPCVYMEGGLSYDIYDYWDMKYSSGCVGFWFKELNGNNEYRLFTFRNSNNNSCILVKIENNTLRLIVNNKAKYEFAFFIPNVGNINWNFTCVNWDIVEIDGINKMLLRLYVNNNKYVSTVDFNDTFDNGCIYIGGDKSNKLASNLFLKGAVSALMVGLGTSISDEQIMEYYTLTKEHLFNGTNDINSARYSGYSLYNNIDDYIIYPLHDNLDSFYYHDSESSDWDKLEKKSPVKYKGLSKLSTNESSNFNYNHEIKKYCYTCDNNDLIYEFSNGDSGTVAINAYIESFDQEQYIFESYDNNSKGIAIYIKPDKTVRVKIANTHRYLDNFKINTGWNYFSYSYKKNSDLNYHITVVVNDTTLYDTDIELPCNLDNMNIQIGKARYQYTTTIYDNTSYQTSYPLYGQVEMLAISNNYKNASVLKNLKQQLKTLTKTYEYDSTGRVIRHSLHKNKENILSNTITYKKATKNKKDYITNNVEKEEIKVNDTVLTTRKYTFSKGNIINITDSIFGNKSYGYDNRGFLTNDNGTTITYDSNGNIKTYGIKSFTYDSNIKDKLISINGNTINYSPTNPLYPLTYNGNIYTYEGKNLISIYKQIDSNNERTLNYQYNHQGLRIKKIETNTYTPDDDSLDCETTQTTTYYYYEGIKLITEYRNDNDRLDFLYDNNGLLYGFINNKTDKYYYVRDILQNILGIIDSNGNLMVKYNYNAYGELLSITGNNTSLGNRNPFRWKGYYYDKETGLFMVGHRYYNPEWCRWLTPDDVEYLEPNNINGLNLYCYCANNPIMYADPSGHLPEWAAWLISGAAIVGGIVLCATGVGGILGGVLIGAGAGSLINGYVTEANGGDFTAGYIGGAISGALCGVGAGLGGMAFAAASEVANLACMGYLALGVTASFAGGFAGNLAGTVYTSWHNSGFKSVDIDWGETLATSAIMGSLNILAGMGSAMSSIAGSMGRVATDVNSKFALRFLAGLIAGGTEAAYDLTSYLIGKLISAF